MARQARAAAPITVKEGSAFATELRPDLEEAVRPLRELKGLSDAARDELTHWLARRWLRLARACLADEVARAGKATGTTGAWRRMRATYPVIEALCRESTRAWQDACRALCARAEADGDVLGGDSRIEALELLGSRSALPAPALAITFAGGRRWIYKPRDLRVGQWFNELCALLGRLGLSAPLHTRTVIGRSGYGWDEVVEASPCAGPAEVRRYFVRVGALARVLQLLRALDTHAQNIIAAGQHPVLIDYEGLFRPVTSDPSWLRSSPLGTGFLPMWIVGERGMRALNAGGIQEGGDGTLPFTAPGLAEDGVTLVRRPHAGELAPTAPASPFAHRGDILAGYDELCELLPRPEVRAHVARAADVRVRYFPRPQAVYKNIIEACVAPARARFEWQRDPLLARLEGPLAAAERAAVARGFLPLFEAQPGSDALLTGDGPRPGFFPAPALEHLVWETDRERDRDVIVAALAVTAAEAPPPAIASLRRQRPWLGAAVAIADEVLERGHDVGVEWVPWAGVRRLGRLHADLLSGSAGIAVVLAELHVATGLPRLRDAARRAIEPAAVEVDAARRPRALGAWVGLAGQIYALRRCGRLLHDPSLAARADARAADLRSEPSLAAATDDLATGLAGLALVCPEPWVAELLTRRRRTGPPTLFTLAGGLPPSAPRLLDGIRFALRRIARASGARIDLPAAERALWDERVDPRRAEAELDSGNGAAPLDNLELALCAGLHERACSLAGELQGRHDATGSWLPESHVPDRLNPSAMTGVMAVALAFLRLVHPQVPSLRRLD